MVAMNRDLALVREGLSNLALLEKFLNDEERKELEHVRAQASAALQRLATPTPVVQGAPANLVGGQARIFWDGNGYYHALMTSDERTGGPFNTIHIAFKDADSKGFEVVEVNKTRGLMPART